MSIRTRLTLWFAAVLGAALLAMGALCYYELVVEAPRERAAKQPAETQGEEASEILGMLAWCGLPALGLGLGGGWWLMRRTLAPVSALTQAARRLNEHNLSERLPRSRNGDELDDLTEVFNQMTGRLEQSFARIREFTLHASHELKTPLTVIHGELETALQNGPLTETDRARLESELDEVQRLTRIVDGLTLLTKADRGQIALARKPVRLDDLLREACADAQSLARPHDIQVNLADCEALTITGDRDRLRQLLLNLSDNAVKYNDRRGKVTLGLRRADQAAEITIANTGPGIAPEILPRVFDPFFRGDASHSQTIEGCGLGLSIARWIVAAHNGVIHLTSTPGQLTTALVRLPLSPA